MNRQTDQTATPGPRTLRRDAWGHRRATRGMGDHWAGGDQGRRPRRARWAPSSRVTASGRPSCSRRSDAIEALLLEMFLRR